MEKEPSSPEKSHEEDSILGFRRNENFIADQSLSQNSL